MEMSLMYGGLHYDAKLPRRCTFPVHSYVTVTAVRVWTLLVIICYQLGIESNLPPTPSDYHGASQD